MSLAESIAALRMRHKTKMDDGKMLETPGAVIAETDKLTSKIIWRISGRHAKPREKKNGFTDIAAAAIVEEELVNELRRGDN